MVESAFRHIEILESLDFGLTKVSLKASNVPMMLEAYRLFSKRSDYPLHLGLTEAGMGLKGVAATSAALAILLQEGIGDTIRVSLAADPVEEVRVGREILKGLGLRDDGVTVIACPTCGRLEVDMLPMVDRVEKHLAAVKIAYNGNIEFSMSIAFNSGLQVALGITAIAVFAGEILGNELPLVFPPLELGFLIGASVLAGLIAADGEVEWIEGLELLAVYVLAAMSFWFL